MAITRIEQLHEVLEEETPLALLGDDDYVFGCQKCPTSYPALVTSERLDRLAAVEGEVIDEELEKYEDILKQVARWMRSVGLDPVSVDEEVKIVRRPCGVVLTFSDTLDATLRAKGINPEIYLTSFNDQLTAKSAVKISQGVQHVYESHPGKVSCSGPIEVGGRLACGACLETVACPNAGDADEVILLSAEKAVEASFNQA